MNNIYSNLDNLNHLWVLRSDKLEHITKCLKCFCNKESCNHFLIGFRIFLHIIPGAVADIVYIYIHE